MSNLSDAELREALLDVGYTAGPITVSTRPALLKKLKTLTDGPEPKKTPKRSPKKSANSSTKKSSQKTPSSASSSRSSSRSRSNSSTRQNGASLVTLTERVIFDDEPDDFNVSGSRSDPSSGEESLLAKSSPRNTAFHRTPTPTRPTFHKSSNGLFQGASSQRNRADLPSPPASLRADDEEESDHKESSRPMTTAERERIFGTPKPKNVSPLDKLKRFGSSAVGFLSSSDRKPNRYVNHVSERGLYGTPGGRYSPVKQNLGARHEQPAEVNSQLPKYLVIGFGSFTALLGIIYLLTAHEHTVERTQKIITGTVSDVISALYNYAVVPAAVLTVVLGTIAVIFYFYRLRQLKADLFQRNTMNLVDRICDRIREAGVEGIAEQILRDKLFPPTRRTEKDIKLWKAAADFINSSDSRVRCESMLVNGVECNIWVWVNAAPAPESGWQGSAIVEGSTQKTLNRALTRFIKIRNLDTYYNPAHADELEKKVRKKLSPVIPIHYGVVRGNDAAVYMAFSNLDDAKMAFDTFHSQWFNGNLVHVRYMYEERYHARFPGVSLK